MIIVKTRRKTIETEYIKPFLIFYNESNGYTTYLDMVNFMYNAVK